MRFNLDFYYEDYECVAEYKEYSDETGDWCDVVETKFKNDDEDEIIKKLGITKEELKEFMEAAAYERLEDYLENDTE